MKIPRVALPLSLAALVLAGCATSSDVASDRPQVVASFYPLQFVAERVAGPDADVVNLTSPGAEPHDLELTAKQVATLSKADAVIYVAGLQTAVDDVIAETTGPTTIDVADLVKALPAEEEEEHAREGESEQADEHEDEDEHEHQGVDPHLWLNPMNLTKAATAVANTLATADPAHRAAYDERADALIGDLTKLDADFRAGLATCERRTIVTAHAAFAYLAHAYDLEQVPIAGLDPSHEPTAADLARIAAAVKAEGVTTVFTERLVSPAIADTVAREAGARTAVLDPIEGLARSTADESYLTLMRQNLAVIRTANGCS